MRRNINDISIRSKFVLLYLLGVLLPIIVLLVYVLTNVTTEIRAREYQNAEQSLVRVYDTLDTQFAGVLSLSNAISSDSKLAGLFSRQYHTAVEYYRTYYNTISSLFSSMNCRKAENTRSAFSSCCASNPAKRTASILTLSMSWS